MYKTDLMRRVLHYASHGYIHWTSGEISPIKAEALALKFADRYGTSRTEMQRYRAKAKGEANTMLLMLYNPKDKAAPLIWWLMATPGNGLVHEMETLENLRSKSPVITGYELIMLPRKRTDKDIPGKTLKPGWTWRMTAQTFDDWKARILVAIRQKNSELIRQMLHSLGKTPGFRGARVQAYLLYRMARNDWQRTQKGEFPFPAPAIRFLGRHQKARMLDVSQINRKARLKS